VNEVDALKDRVRRLEHELAEATEQHDATVEVLKVIGESPFDLEPVFNTVLANAVRLCRADSGQIWTADEEDRFHRVSYLGGSTVYNDLLAGTVIEPGRSTVVGKVALEKRTVQVEDVLVDPDYSFYEAQKLGGFRTLLGVPMLFEGEPIGVLTVWRTRIDPFADDEVELISTFAAQGAIAIQQMKQKTELMIASDHKSEFLKHMSHELRTPLNSIIGFSQILLDSEYGELTPKQRKHVTHIFNSGHLQLRLVNDVLDLTKYDFANAPLEQETFALKGVLEEALALVDVQASQKQQTLTLEVEPEELEVSADRLRITQVAVNLLSNANKATPSGGRIDVIAREVDSCVEISVTDTGEGIPAELQERIFEVFYRLPGAKPREGYGIGLPLSRLLVERHGGRLSVESEPGEGSTFRFTLPTSPVGDIEHKEHPEAADGDALAVTALGQEIAREPTSNALVLLVEDDEHSIDLFSTHLEKDGYTVVVARDGEEGLEAARRLRPAAIILDILLPKIDGWGFLKRIKADPELEHTSVIVVSMLDERGQGLTLGAVDYLVKPVEREVLLQALGRAVALPSKATVLVIDDDPMALELVATILEPAGYRVLTARSGGEGLSLARTHQPDVIILDLVMPEPDGFSVLEQLSEERATVDIPILIATAKALTPDDKQRLNGRIAALAYKAEFDRNALLALVSRCSSRGGR
jgi:signal transduction histidine kinase/CheY-like chemotaxis protein